MVYIRLSAIIIVIISLNHQNAIASDDDFRTSVSFGIGGFLISDNYKQVPKSSPIVIGINKTTSDNIIIGLSYGQLQIKRPYDFPLIDDFYYSQLLHHLKTDVAYNVMHLFKRDFPISVIAGLGIHSSWKTYSYLEMGVEIESWDEDYLISLSQRETSHRFDLLGVHGKLDVFYNLNRFKIGISCNAYSYDIESINYTIIQPVLGIHF